MKSIYVDSQGNEWENGGTYTDASLVTMADGTTVQADVSALQTDNTQNKSNISKNASNIATLNSSVTRIDKYKKDITMGSNSRLRIKYVGSYGGFLIAGQGSSTPFMYMVSVYAGTVKAFAILTAGTSDQSSKCTYNGSGDISVQIGSWCHCGVIPVGAVDVTSITSEA